MNNLGGGDNRNDNPEIDRNDDCSKNAKGSDRSDVGACVCKECDGCRAGCHKDGTEGAPPAIGHTFVQIATEQTDVGGLAPSITEDENIVSSDTKHNEYCHLVQRRVHSNLKDARINQVGHWEGEQDQQHRYPSQEKTLKVEHDVAEDEQDAENCIGDVTHERLSEVAVVEQ